MQDLSPPPFLLGTMSWLAYGYFYGAPLPPGYGATSTATDPWEVFVYVRDEAKAGRFNSLHRLTSFLLPPLGETLAEACLGLMGDAGSTEEIAFIAKVLEEGPIELLPIAADAAGATGYLGFVPLMLGAWQRVSGRLPHLRIGSAISRLMEPPGGPISQLTEKFTPDANERESLLDRGGRYAELAKEHPGETTGEFADAVGARYRELHPQFAPGVSLWRGEPFSLKVLLDQMHQFVHDPAMATQGGLFIRVRRKIEATTGRNMSNCFRRGIFDPLGAAAVLEDLLENVDVTQYQEGERYFFGHKVKAAIAE
jgi:hypothetical protein